MPLSCERKTALATPDQTTPKAGGGLRSSHHGVLMPSCVLVSLGLLPHSRQTALRASPAVRRNFESYNRKSKELTKSVSLCLINTADPFHLSVRNFCPNYPSHRYGPTKQPCRRQELDPMTKRLRVTWDYSCCLT